MRLKVFIVVSIFLLWVLCPQSLFGQKNCAEFEVSADGNRCKSMTLIPWITFGDGWTSTIRGANIGSKSPNIVQFSWKLLAPTPMTNGRYNHLVGAYTDNLTMPLGAVHFGEVGGIILNPGDSVEMDFFSGFSGCDAHGQNCYTNPLDKNILFYGSVLIGYQADGPEALRGLVKPSVQFNHTNGYQASEPALSPAPVWRSPVSATSDGKLGYSMALANPGTFEIVVRGTLMKNPLGMVISTQEWKIPGGQPAPGGTIGVVFAGSRTWPTPGFGNEMFQGGTSFTGWVKLEVLTPGGKVTMVGLQYSTTPSGRQTMSSADIQPSQQ